MPITLMRSTVCIRISLEVFIGELRSQHPLIAAAALNCVMI
jgi:hypothetical protein